MYHSTLQLHLVHCLVSLSQDASLAHRASQKALLSEQPCCSQTLLQPFWRSNTDFGCATSLLAKIPPSHSHERTTGQRSSRGTHSLVVTAGRKGTSTVGPGSALPAAACTQMSTSGLGENLQHRQKVFTPFLNEIPQLVSRNSVFCLFVCCYSFSKFMESTAKQAS